MSTVGVVVALLGVGVGDGGTDVATGLVVRAGAGVEPSPRIPDWARR